MARKVAKPAASPDVEVVSKPGLGIDDGIVLTTTLLLIAAIVVLFVQSKVYDVA